MAKSKKSGRVKPGKKAKNPAELVILGANGKRKRRARRVMKNVSVKSAIAKVKSTVKKLVKNPKGKKRNPSNDTSEQEQAVKLFETFHGRDATQVLNAQRSSAIRLDYTALGPLLGLAPFTQGLRIPSPTHWDDGGYPVLKDFKGVKVASSPNGQQLYIIGGNQDLSDALGYFQIDTKKDLLDLGEAAYIVYEARKAPKFDPTQYMHRFGEDGGEMPRIMYDKIKKEIFLVGGSYKVEAPGITN